MCVKNLPASRYRYAYTRVVDCIDYKIPSTEHSHSHRLADDACWSPIRASAMSHVKADIRRACPVNTIPSIRTLQKL